jgi:hypothetical protein
MVRVGAEHRHNLVWPEQRRHHNNRQAGHKEGEHALANRLTETCGVDWLGNPLTARRGGRVVANLGCANGVCKNLKKSVQVERGEMPPLVAHQQTASDNYREAEMVKRALRSREGAQKKGGRLRAISDEYKDKEKRACAGPHLDLMQRDEKTEKKESSWGWVAAGVSTLTLPAAGPGWIFRYTRPEHRFKYDPRKCLLTTARPAQHSRGSMTAAVPEILRALDNTRSTKSQNT